MESPLLPFAEFGIFFLAIAAIYMMWNKDRSIPTLIVLFLIAALALADRLLRETPQELSCLTNDGRAGKVLVAVNAPDLGAVPTPKIALLSQDKERPSGVAFDIGNDLQIDASDKGRINTLVVKYFCQENTSE